MQNFTRLLFWWGKVVILWWFMCFWCCLSILTLSLCTSFSLSYLILSPYLIFISKWSWLGCHGVVLCLVDAATGFGPVSTEWPGSLVSGVTRPKSLTGSTGKRSKVIKQESVDGWRKIEEDIHIWQETIFEERQRLPSPPIYNHLLSCDWSWDFFLHVLIRRSRRNFHACLLGTGTGSCYSSFWCICSYVWCSVDGLQLSLSQWV